MKLLLAFTIACLAISNTWASTVNIGRNLLRSPESDAPSIELLFGSSSSSKILKAEDEDIGDEEDNLSAEDSALEEDSGEEDDSSEDDKYHDMDDDKDNDDYNDSNYDHNLDAADYSYEDGDDANDDDEEDEYKDDSGGDDDDHDGDVFDIL